MANGVVALITGAGSGIGRATALKFAEMGYRLVLADINAQANSAIADSVNAKGGKAIAVPTDVSKSADVQNLLDKTVSSFGRLDYAVNNAGVHTFSPLHVTSEEAFDRTIDINLRGVFLCMKHELPIMMENKDSPAIVNVASVAGLRGIANTAAYCASKAGVIMMTQSAAVESAGKVRINAICPGSTRTRMVTDLLEAAGAPIPDAYGPFPGVCPMNRLGEPLEIAETIHFLCSSSAKYITGTHVVVDGGMTSYIPVQA